MSTYSEWHKRQRENQPNTDKTDEKQYTYYGGGTRYIDKMNAAKLSATEWEKQANNLLKEYNDFYGNSNGDSWIDTSRFDDASYQSRANALLNRTDDFLTMFNGNSDAQSAVKEIASHLTDAKKAASNNTQFYSQFDNADKYSEWKTYQKNYYNKWGKYAEADDFAEYSQKGAEMHKDKPVGYAYGGDYIRAKRSDANYTDDGILSADEESIYNYLLAKNGKKAADKYLTDDLMRDKIAYRYAQSETDELKNSPWLRQILAYPAISVGAGINNRLSGIVETLTDTPQAPSNTQIMSQIISSEASGFGKYAFDAGMTVGSMLPDIFLSNVTGGVAGALGATGNALKLAGQAGYFTSMGLGVYGPTKHQAMADGYSEGQASLYAASVVAIEMLTEKLTDGLSAAGGAIKIDKILSKLGRVDNSLARIALKLGGSITGEISEEILSNYLEPAAKSIIFGEDYDAPTLEENLETAIITALSTGALEAGGTIAQDVSRSNYYKTTYGDNINGMVSGALTVDPDNKLAAKIKKKIDSGKKISGNLIGNLYEQNSETLFNDTQTAVNEYLAAYPDLKNIKNVDEIITKSVLGQELTKKETQILESSAGAKQIAEDIKTQYRESFENAYDEQLYKNELGVQDETDDTTTVTPQNYEQILNDAFNADSDEAVQTATTVQNSNSNAETGINTPAQSATKSNPNGNIRQADEYAGTTIEDAAKKYGKHAQAMIKTYNAGQDVDTFDAAYGLVYEMGKSGVSFDYVGKNEVASYLTDEQRQIAYRTGMNAAQSEAKEQAGSIKSNGKTGRRKGTVKGEGVKISDLKKSFNDKQGQAYNILTTIAKATGVDIVLYKSESTADGSFTDAQGRFSWDSGKIYIDINAGLSTINDVGDLAKYTMLRTFSHEFTHFIEKFSPVMYNELRTAVFETLTAKGKDVDALIGAKMDESHGKIGYEKASREVVAEAMTDVLPDSHFIETLANEHKTVFEKIAEKLKEFFEQIKMYFKDIVYNPSTEANALKENIDGTVKYIDDIVAKFDAAAVDAVENYQKENAVTDTTETNKFGTITQYKSSEAYKLNDALRNNADTAKEYQQFIESLDNEISNCPKYTGTVYRNIVFDYIGGKVAFDKFMTEHEVGESVTYSAYTSTSTQADGYEVEGQYVVHMVIDSANGRDIDGYGNNAEREILFARNTTFIVTEIAHDADETPTIYMKEVIDNEIRQIENAGIYRGNKAVDNRQPDGLQRSAMSELQAGKQENKNVRDISGRNTRRRVEHESGERVLQNVQEEGIRQEQNITPARDNPDVVNNTEPVTNDIKTVEKAEENGKKEKSEQHQDRKYLNGETENGRREIQNSIGSKPEENGREQTEGGRTSKENAGGNRERASGESGTGRWDYASDTGITASDVLRNAVRHDADRVETGVHGQGQGIFSEHVRTGERDSGRVDNEGRQLSKEISEQLEESEIVDIDGNPIAVYHFTPDKEFNVFKKGDTGFHFGNIEQAHGRKTQKGYEKGRTIRAYLNIKNPAWIDTDIMSFQAKQLAYKLWSMELITFEQRDLVEQLSLQGMGYDSPASRKLREILAEKEIDGVVYPNETEGKGDSYIAFYDEQIIGREDVEQYQQRKQSLTDREVLEFAADKINTKGLTPAENSALEIFKARLSKLKELEVQKAEAQERYKELKAISNGKETKAARASVVSYEAQIKNAEAQVLKVEESEVMKRVLKEARGVVEKEERIRGKEALGRYRAARMESANVKKYKTRIKKDVDTIMSWAIHPSGKDVLKHVPDAIKNSVLPFLANINLMSKRQLNGGEATKADAEFAKQLGKIREILKRISENAEYMLPAGFENEFNTIAGNIQALIANNNGEFVINRMSASELKDLSHVVKTLKSLITDYNKLYGDLQHKTVTDAGDNSIAYMSGFDKPSGRTNRTANAIIWDCSRPAHAFDRFGEGGKTIWKSLTRGQAQLAFNIDDVIKFAKSTYSKKEAKAWNNEIKNIDLGGEEVRMTAWQAMYFYMLTKRPDAMRHILGEGEGVRVEAFEKGKPSDTGHKVTEADIEQITESLSERQKAVAESLQRFMAEKGGKWGNEVSYARFGEAMFTDTNYMPIIADDLRLGVNAVNKHNENTDLYSLLNKSFTKSIDENAKCRIVIRSLLDVFADHMSQMAQYNALALPVLNTLKWLNYRTDGDDKTSVREQMARAYGKPVSGDGKEGRGFAESFVLNLIKSMSGAEALGSAYDSIVLQGLHKFNMAQVAWNLRVVVQQPMSIMRAASEISYKSIIKAIGQRSVETPKVSTDADITEMENLSGIAKLKALGFYDVNVSRSVSDMITYKSGFIENVAEIGLKGAEYADRKTWGTLWRACKIEVAEKRGIKPGSEGYIEAVTELFEDVIYRTQVVDSVLTKNQFLRSKSTTARIFGSFMSEPMTTSSMLVSVWERYNADRRRGLSAQAALQKHGRTIARTAVVYSVGQILVAMAESLIDAFRDDDDYKTYLEKYIDALTSIGGNLWDELMPVNKLPVISDAYELIKTLANTLGVDGIYGNDSPTLIMRWAKPLTQLAKIIEEGEDTKYTPYAVVYRIMQATAAFTGLPTGAMTRTVAQVWNNTVGEVKPELKLKIYEAGAKNEIKYAYIDGYLSEDEAVRELLDKGVSDDEEAAYWQLREWDDADGHYSKFKRINSAVLNGEDTKEAIKELTEHGYTEKQIKTQLKTKIGVWYKGTDKVPSCITKQQAEDFLVKHCDMKRSDAKALVTKWSCKVVTGIDYNEIKDEYIAGNITASRAITMYEKYGGITRDEAREKVMQAEFIRKNPQLSDISDSAVAGYNKYCKYAGVDAATYYKAWQYKTSLSGKDSKERALTYINGLNLSRAQKNAVYYALGWSENKLYEAPWY